MIRRLAALALLALLCAVMAGCGDGDSGAAPAGCAPDDTDCVEVGIGQPIYVGAFLALDFTSGLDVLASVRLALDYLDGVFDQNPGQLLGHDIALIVEKDECTPASGRTGALRLLGEPGLLAAIGPTCSGSAFGSAARVFAERNVLLISPSNTAPGLTAPDTHERTYFRTAFNDAIQGSVVADFIFTNRQIDAAVTVAKAEDAYSQQLSETFADSFANLGGTIERSFQLAPGDNRASVGKALAADPPGAVFVSLQTPDCGLVVQGLRAQPALAATTIVVAESCQTEDFVELLGPQADGVFASGPDFSTVDENAFYREWYLPAYRQLTGNDPNGVFGPSGFDATALLLDAIRRTAVVLPGGALRVSRTALRRSMLDIRGYAGLSGVLSCRPTGDCNEGARIAIYESPAWPILKGDKAVPVFSQFKTLSEVGLTN